MRRTLRLIMRGDAVGSLPDALGQVRHDAAICVTHTHVTNQMPDDARAELGHAIQRSARDREMYRLSAEWLDTTYPSLELTAWEKTVPTTRRLAFCDPHGE